MRWTDLRWSQCKISCSIFFGWWMNQPPKRWLVISNFLRWIHYKKENYHFQRHFVGLTSLDFRSDRICRERNDRKHPWNIWCWTKDAMFQVPGWNFSSIFYTWNQSHHSTCRPMGVWLLRKSNTTIVFWSRSTTWSPQAFCSSLLGTLVTWWEVKHRPSKKIFIPTMRGIRQHQHTRRIDVWMDR